MASGSLTAHVSFARFYSGLLFNMLAKSIVADRLAVMNRFPDAMQIP